MLNRLIPCCSFTLWLLLAASVVNASDNGSAQDTSDRNQFIVGDGYDVTVERHGVKEYISGLLVKTTDEWIVLANVSAGAYGEVTGTPVLMHLPVVGSYFQKTTRKEVMCKDYHWIPRDGIHVEKHQTDVAAKVKEEFKDDTPKLDSICSVRIVIRGQGESVYFGIDKTRLIPDTADIVRMVNRAIKDFTKQEAEILYLESQVELTPEQIKLVNSK